MIFPFVWRILPGPVVLKVLELLVLIAAVVWVLFTFVYPWIASDILPPPDGTVDVSPSP
ncbi:hypothetical protein LQK89_03175 [Curtobacterium sp. C1]|uniref:Uncharacterized protein n=1 Tax=Curtobacterium citreum TaxID=2036 RepID=A0A850DUR9_9MICO|nr:MULTISPECIES: hypothetical protein [Curtobacterium]MCS5485610.1 hypothetical protein [Curtobacterium flaccumfaciens pv. basellae]MCS6523298.1 hypothetical protein [Curtobacterium citreum]MDK8171054.1 hypothetical protein [Curtobacterium citreum]NUU27322.1 hypothetical protein [Curtobacterium albidum]QKS11705.1 hypothetical protein HUN60_04090 [Curtobacterium sp. csp3]